MAPLVCRRATARRGPHPGRRPPPRPPPPPPRPRRPTPRRHRSPPGRPASPRPRRPPRGPRGPRRPRARGGHGPGPRPGRPTGGAPARRRRRPARTRPPRHAPGRRPPRHQPPRRPAARPRPASSPDLRASSARAALTASWRWRRAVGPLVQPRQRPAVLVEGPAEQLQAAPRRRQLVLGGRQLGTVPPGLEVGPLGEGQGLLRRRQLVALGGEGGRLLLGRGQLGRQAGALGLEGGHHVDVGRGVEGGGQAPGALAQHPGGPPGPLHQSLHPAEGRGQVDLPAGGELGRGGRGRLVQSGQRRRAARAPRLARAARASAAAVWRPASSASSVAATCRRTARSSSATVAWERAAAAWRSRGRIWRRTSRTRSPRRSRFSWVAASRRSARSRRRRCLSTPAASSMMARRSSGRALRTVSSWPWPMIMCCWRPTPESDSSSWMSSSRQGAPLMAYSLSPERNSVRVMVTSAMSTGQPARGVVDGERHLGPAQGGPAGGAGEDDVLHLLRAQRARPLGAEHPGHGVDHVGLAAAVGADHHGDPRARTRARWGRRRT